MMKKKLCAIVLTLGLILTPMSGLVYAEDDNVTETPATVTGETEIVEPAASENAEGMEISSTDAMAEITEDAESTDDISEPATEAAPAESSEEEAAIDDSDKSAAESELSATVNATPKVSIKSARLLAAASTSKEFTVVAYEGNGTVKVTVNGQADIPKQSAVWNVDVGDEMIIEAIPNAGYKFAYWMYAGEGQSAGQTPDNPLTYTIAEERIYYAVFEKDTNILSATINVDVPAAGDSAGSLTSAISVPGGEGYSFDSVVCYEQFPEYDEFYNIKTPEFKGTFEAGKTYYAIVTLTPNDGYYLVQGGDSPTTVSVSGATLEQSDNHLLVSNYMTSSGLEQWGQAYISFIIPATTYTVIFDMGGYYDDIALQTVNSGETLDTAELPTFNTRCTTPANTNLYLQGWYTKPIAEIGIWEASAYQFDLSTPITSDMKLYAGWRGTAHVSAYKVTDSGAMSGSGGKISVETPRYSTKGEYGEEYVTGASLTSLAGAPIKLSAKADDGYVFKGWVNSGGSRSWTTTTVFDFISTDPEVTLTFTGGSSNSSEVNFMKYAYEAIFVAHTHSLTKTDKIDATCETAGTEAYWTCSECGKMFSDAAGTTEITAPVTIPALGHDWDDGTITTEPTCTEKGVKTYTCTVCGKTKTEEIDALGHDWSAWEITKEATETEDGEEVRTCSRCGETETRVIPHLVVEYRNTEGDGSTWDKGSSESLTFIFKRSVNDDTTFSHFAGIKVDGEDVDESNYTAVSGSVVIDLSPDYLETLDAGKHTITALFDDGNNPTASFTIAAEETEEETEADTTSTSTDGTGTKTTSGTPKTGDETNVMIWLMLMSAAVLALFHVITVRRNRR